MAAAGVRINRTGLVIITILVVGAIIYYQLHWRIHTTRTRAFELKEVDVTKLPEIPAATDNDLSSFVAEREFIVIEVNGKTLNTYSLQMMPKSSQKGVVLLLHGLGDSSHNWVQVNTMHLLAHWGYKAVAIDLPGHGKNSAIALGDLSDEDYLAAVMKALGPPLPVIVAPSMGGRFAIPYLFQTPSVGVQRAAGFVAVAPVASEKLESNYPESQLRTLILYGENDVNLGRLSRNKLQALPRSNIIVVPNAGHAVFKDQPELFHRALYHYLNYLQEENLDP